MANKSKKITVAGVDFASTYLFTRVIGASNRPYDVLLERYGSLEHCAMVYLKLDNDKQLSEILQSKLNSYLSTDKPKSKKIDNQTRSLVAIAVRYQLNKINFDDPELSNILQLASAQFDKATLKRGLDSFKQSLNIDCI